MQLPNLEGQPPWVVVVVVVLFVLGAVGVAALRRRAGIPETEGQPGNEPVTVAPQGQGAHMALSAMKDTVQVLAASAEREAAAAARAGALADEANEEAKMLRRQLAECEASRSLLEERQRVLQARLDACEELGRHYRTGGAGA